MRDLTSDFDKLKIDFKKLTKYGFKKNNNEYEYRKDIGNFYALITLEKNNKIAKLIDQKTNEEYVIVDLKTTLGEYASKIKEEYDNLIQDIINKCTTIEVFKSKESYIIKKYIKEKYRADLEFLWDSLDAAIWRNNETQKWFGLLMIIDASKLDIKKAGNIEILNLHYQKGMTTEVIDNKSIFPGYHMNKNSWITIVLNDKVSLEKVFKLIDNSYELSKNN